MFGVKWLFVVIRGGVLEVAFPGGKLMLLSRGKWGGDTALVGTPPNPISRTAFRVLEYLCYQGHYSIWNQYGKWIGCALLLFRNLIRFFRCLSVQLRRIWELQWISMGLSIQTCPLLRSPFIRVTFSRSKLNAFFSSYDLEPLFWNFATVGTTAHFGGVTPHGLSAWQYGGLDREQGQPAKLVRLRPRENRWTRLDERNFFFIVVGSIDIEISRRIAYPWIL